MYCRSNYLGLFAPSHMATRVLVGNLPKKRKDFGEQAVHLRFLLGRSEAHNEVSDARLAGRDQVAELKRLIH